MISESQLHELQAELFHLRALARERDALLAELVNLEHESAATPLGAEDSQRGESIYIARRFRAALNAAHDSAAV